MRPKGRSPASTATCSTPRGPTSVPVVPAPTSSTTTTPSSSTATTQGQLVPAGAFHEGLELHVTDLRASTWDSVPHAERKQQNIKIEIPGNEIGRSFNLIKLKIKSELSEVGDKNKKDFVLCNPDRAVIDSTNFMRLKSGNALILLDSEDQPMPFNYKLVFNTAPHSKTVTSQKGAYHDGTGCNNVAGFALAELVDNSLSATKGMPNRRIQIKIYENSENTSIHVLDNGHGMTSEALQTGLVYKAPKESRRFSSDTNFTNNDTQIGPADEDLSEEAHPLHLNSNISKFGAGMKKAVFFLGAQVIIMTKTSGNIDVLETVYSAELLEKHEGTHRDEAWTSSCIHRAPGVAREDLPSQVRALIMKEESNKRSFTHLVIDRLDPDILQLLRVNKDQQGQKCPSVEKQLAHIFHYYIHGRDGNVSETHDFLVDIIVTRVDPRGNWTPTNLGELPIERVDLESQFVQTAAECFLFTVEFTKFTNRNNVDARGGNKFKVGGIIRYHPYMYTGETIPAGKPARGRVDDEVTVLNDGEGGSSPDQEDEAEQTSNPGPGGSRSTTASAGAPRKCDDFFAIWWNGRLVPMTRLPSFDWCSPGARSSKFDKLYDRISGSLFFDSHVEEITDNKLNISETTKLLEMFNEKKLHTQQATFQRVTIAPDGTLKAKGKPMKKDFEVWLKGCTKHDKQVQYSEPAVGEEKIIHEQLVYVQYMKATWDISLKVGDMVKIRNSFMKTPKTPSSAQSESSPPLLGRVVNFLVRSKFVDDFGNKIFAPLSFFTLQPLPTAFYNDETLIKHMGLIDVEVVKQDAEALLKVVEDELRMKIIIRHQETDYELNREKTKFVNPIPIDGTLWDRICLDVVKADGVSELRGLLPHPQLPQKTRFQAKKIFMSARIHEINNDGTRDLFHTCPVCPYVKNERGDGYFFKGPSLNLKNMEFMKKPGRFVITFRAYIDLSAAMKGPGVTLGTPLPESPRRGSRIRRPAAQARDSVSDDEQDSDRRNPETAYEIEWKKEVDGVGRKILLCHDKTEIRLPYLEIEFTTVAGNPTSAAIEQVGEEGHGLQIGVPFPILLSFKDAKDNKAMPPEDIDELYKHAKPLVSIGGGGPGRKPPGPAALTLKCTWGNVEPVGDLLAIKDVKITGLLRTQLKDIKLNVAVRLQKKILSLPYPCQIRVGNPTKLKALESSFEVENGEIAKILCQSLDCSNNIVTTVLERRGQAQDQVDEEDEDQHDEDVKPIILTCDFYKEGESDEAQKLLTCNLLTTSSTRRQPETTEIIDVTSFPGLATPCTLDCILSYKECAKVKVKIHVKPSTLPERLRMYEIIEEIGVQIENGVETHRELGATTLVRFKLFDGLNKEIPYDSTKHKFCFEGWPKKSKVNRLSSLELRIPMRAKTRKSIRTVVEVKLPTGGIKNVSHEFYVSTSPGDPVKLEVFLLNQLNNIQTSTDENAEENVMAPPMLGRVQVPIDDDLVSCVAQLTDQHGNIVRDGMDMEYISEVRMEWDHFSQECEPVPAEEVGGGIKGEPEAEAPEFPGSFLIKFRPPRDPGDKDIMFTLGEFQYTLKVSMMPGRPAGLAFELDGLKIRRNKTIARRNMTTTHVRVHLVDSQQNPTTAVDQVELSIELGNETTWAEQQNPQLSTSIILRPGGEESGIADFGNLIVGASKDTVPLPCQSRVERCGKQVCFQVRNIKAFVKDRPDLKQAFNKFHIGARSDVPEYIKVDTSGAPFHYRAGSLFANLKATLIAEDRMPMMTGIQLQHLTMHISDKNSIFTEEAEVNMEIIQTTSIEGGVFTFGNAVTRAGVYTTKFVYCGLSKSIEKIFDDLIILSSDVASIQPEEKLEHDPVSVSGVDADAAERTIVSDFKLVLRDRFGNIVNGTTRGANVYNEDLEGTVRVDLLEPEDSIGLLRLEQHASIIGRDLSLTNGQITFPALVIEKNLHLRPNSLFKLQFTAQLCNGYKTLNYELRFTVSNNILQLKEIKKLESEHAKVKLEVEQIHGVITAIANNKDRLEEKRNEAERAEFDKRSELLSLLNEVGQGEQAEEIVGSLQTRAQVNARLGQLKEAHSLIKWEREGSRINGGVQTITTNLPSTWDNKDPAVLGQVGRLVEVKSEGGGHAADTKLQIVLSWHMQSDLDTVVVLEKARGQALNREHTQAPFMLLDLHRDYQSVHQDWNNTIPEALLQFGHPVYARSLLQLPSEPSERIYNIRKVFGVVLGDTVVVDSLEDAIAFMAEYNRLAGLGRNLQIRGRCPPVITRDGHRLTAKAVIGGGSRNQAPTHIERLNHRFGMGPNLDMTRLKREMDLLSELKGTLKEKVDAIKSMEKYTEEIRGALEEWQAKYNEVNEKRATIEIQLDIMKRSQPSVTPGGAGGQPLVVTPVGTPQTPQTRSRSRQPDGELTPSPAKRTRHEHDQEP